MPSNVAAELFVNSTWIDITSDVRVANGIQISRGRPNESGRTPPSQCQFALNNSSGNYSSRNPLGAYYGSLGRNTPLRVALRTEVDTFTRTVSSGWGSSDTGGAWSFTGDGGTLAASNFNVASGVGTHLIPAAVAHRMSYLAASLYSDVDIAATVTTGISNVTGGAIEPLNLVIGGLGIADYYLMRVSISTAEVVTVSILHTDGTILAAAVTVPLTYTGQALRGRFQLEGHTLRAKVWAAASLEPYGWNATVSGGAVSLKQFNRAKGWVGIRSGIAAGNTNASPTFAYDSVEVRNYRFTGEVSEWPASWDLSGATTDTQVTASGITRRLGQGAPPTPSAFYRAFTSLAVPPLVYWPMEDGKEATEMASGIGGAPLTFRGAPKLASNNDFVASKAIPALSGADFGDWDSIDVAANTGVIQTTFLLSVPTNGDADSYAIIAQQTGGTARYWNIEYGTLGGGSIRVEAFDNSGATLLSSAWVDFDLDGRPCWVSFELVQSGGNVNWAVTIMDAKTLGAGSTSGTLGGQTIGALNAVKVNPDRGLSGTAIGHVASRNYFTSLFALATYLGAFAGETARGRVDRLSVENDVPFGYLYNGKTSSTLVGTQGLQSYLDLINEAATADLGMLYEGRSSASIVYRTRNSLYSQVPTLALDYAAGHVAAPFQPTEDDQNLRNGIQVTRKNGSSTRVEQTIGPLSVSSPFDARGAGRYDSEVTQSLYADSQLPDAAGWLLLLGTVDESRYPAIGVNLVTFSRQLLLDSLAVDVGARLTIDNPKAGLDPNQISQIVQGYKETIGSHSHGIVFNCSPESPYATLRLDVPTMDKLDSGTSRLTTGYTSSATALSVTTTDPLDLWITGAVSIPIMVAGERMLCTNISGSSSPQTFTVTRSTNGVVKAQPAGAEVHVARRATLAY